MSNSIHSCLLHLGRLKALILFTEDSAKQQAENFSPNVDALVKRVLALYAGTSMPMSDARGL